MRYARENAQVVMMMCAALILGGCAGPQSSSPSAAPAADPQLNQLSDNAHTAYRLGNYEHAARLYGAALNRARATDDAAQIAGAAYNMAICEMGLGQFDAARQHLKESKGESARGGLPSGDVLLVEAKVARLQGKPDEAAALAQQVTDSNGASQPGQRAAAAVVLGLIACDRNDATGAIAQSEIVRHAATGSVHDPALDADLAELSARIAELQGKYDAAADAYDRLAALSRDCGQYNRMARALTLAGRSYGKLQNWPLAADRLFRAARSEQALGHTAAAHSIATEAADYDNRSGLKTELGGRINVLLEQTKPPTADH